MEDSVNILFLQPKIYLALSPVSRFRSAKRLYHLDCQSKKLARYNE